MKRARTNDFFNGYPKASDDKTTKQNHRGTKALRGLPKWLPPDFNGLDPPEKKLI